MTHLPGTAWRVPFTWPAVWWLCGWGGLSGVVLVLVVPTHRSAADLVRMLACRVWRSVSRAQGRGSHSHGRHVHGAQALPVLPPFWGGQSGERGV